MKKDSVAKNYLFSAFYQVLMLITPLITTPYIARVLNVELFGVYNYTASLVGYYITIASIGIAFYAQREIAYISNDRESRSKVFFEIQIFKMVTFTLSGIIYWVVLCRNGNNAFLYKIQLISVIASLLDISWFFQGIELFKFTVLRNAAVKIVGIIAIFSLVKTTENFYLYVFILCITTLVGNITLWIYLPKYISKVSMKSLNIIRHIKPNLVLFIPQFASQIYLSFNKTMIGLLANTTEVGYYSQAEKIIIMANSVLTSLGVVLLPRIASLVAQKDYEKIKQHLENSFETITGFSVPIMFGIMFIANDFIPCFLGKGYNTSIYVMITLAPLVIIKCVSVILGSGFLVPLKLERVYTLSVICGALANVLLNMLLISNWGSIGASVSMIIAESTVAIIQYYGMHKAIQFNGLGRIYFRYISMSIPMSLFLLITFFVGDFSGIKLLIRCFIAVLIYFITLYISKDKLILQMQKIIKKILL